MFEVSVVISAWNEEKKLKRCLSSVAWADEIIVIDSSSTDKTPQIAKEHGATVIRRPNNPMLNVNKNYGFGKAKGPWILSLDADEEIPAELVAEIKEKTRANTDISGYWIPRKNIIFGKWIAHGLWWPDKQLRLFQKGKGKFPQKHVHEYVEVDGPTDTLHATFTHFNYESVSQFLKKLELYTDNEVKNLTSTNYQLAWYDAIRFPASDFLKIYFAQEGYKDGLHGLVLALFQGFYSFVVFAKLWEQQAFEEKDMPVSSVVGEMYARARDFRYWMWTARIGTTKDPLKKLIGKIQRRLHNL